MVVKTAISLPEKTFKRINAEARKRKMSRSRLIASLMEEHWKRMEDAQFAARVKAAYGSDYELDDEEKAWLEFGRRQMGELLKDEKW